MENGDGWSMKLVNWVAKFYYVRIEAICRSNETKRLILVLRSHFVFVHKKKQKTRKN